MTTEAKTSCTISKGNNKNHKSNSSNATIGNKIDLNQGHTQVQPKFNNLDHNNVRILENHSLTGNLVTSNIENLKTNEKSGIPITTSHSNFIIQNGQAYTIEQQPVSMAQQAQNIGQVALRSYHSPTETVYQPPEYEQLVGHATRAPYNYKNNPNSPNNHSSTSGISPGNISNDNNTQQQRNPSNDSGNGEGNVGNQDGNGNFDGKNNNTCATHVNNTVNTAGNIVETVTNVLYQASDHVPMTSTNNNSTHYVVENAGNGFHGYASEAPILTSILYDGSMQQPQRKCDRVIVSLCYRVWAWAGSLVNAGI